MKTQKKIQAYILALVTIRVSENLAKHETCLIIATNVSVFDGTPFVTKVVNNLLLVW